MTMLVPIRTGITLADLHHLDRAEAIATYLIDTGDGVGIVDPGPSSTREALEAALRALGAAPGDVRHVFLTHIHLDHAGITGTLITLAPRARVYVHERGAPHLVDPRRLIDSATRIYGDEMQRLWGTFLPVPLDRLHVLGDRDRLTIGTRRWRSAHTPGHAVHHVAYLDEHAGVVFTGDLTGEATQHDTPALPVAPPPDIDLPAWRQSLDIVEAWRPEALLLTHFGPVNAPSAHIGQMWERLVEWSDLVRASLDRPGSDEARAEDFADEQLERLTSDLPPERAAHVDRNAIVSSWHGLARFARKQASPISAKAPSA